MGRLRRQATSSARWTAVAMGTRVGTQFLQLAILARLLEPGDFGLMGLAAVVVVFGQAFGDFGINNAIIHFQDATRRELSSLYWLNMFAGVAVFGLVWVAAPLTGPIFGEPQLPGIVRMVAWVFVIAPLGHQFQVLLERDLRFRRIAAFETTAVVLGAVVGVSCAFQGKGVHSLIFALLAQVAARSLMLAVIGWRTWPPQFVFAWKSVNRFVRFGMFQMGERSLAILAQQLDKILIGYTMGTETLGYYQLAYMMIVRPHQMINPIFTRVAFPVFSRVQHDIDRMRKGFLEMIEVVAAIMAPIFWGLAVLAAPVIGVQLGPGYEICVPLLRIMSILGFLYAIGNPLGSVLMARGRADVAFYLNVMRTTLFAIAIWLGSRHGLEGIAWALVIVIAGITFPVGLWVRWWLLRLTVREYIGIMSPFVLAGAVAAGITFALDRLVAWPGDVAELIATGTIFLGVYGGTLWMWRRDRVVRIVRLLRS